MRGQIEPGDDAVLARRHHGLGRSTAAGTMASVVMSPARPRSSSSACAHDRLDQNLRQGDERQSGSPGAGLRG